MRRLLAPRDDAPRDDQLVSSDLSRTEAPRVEAPRRQTNWERRRHEAEASGAQAMALLEQMATSIGGIFDLYSAPPPNDVLLQGTYLLGASGIATWSWKQVFAGVLVANLSAHKMTVTSFAPAEATPVQGAGVLVVPSGFYRLAPMRGSTLTVYGTATSKLDLAVFVRPRTPSGGQCGQG